METAFYEDHMQMPYNSSRDDLRKRLTLDLNSPRLAKKPRFDVLLSSPDLHMLKLASPELDKLIMQQNGLVTSTPTPGQFLFPKSVTQEQELYARGFVEALAELHQQNEHNASAGPNASQINPTSTTSSAGLEIMVTSSAMAPSSYSTYTYTTLGGSGGGGASHSHLSGGSSVAGDSDSNVSRSGVPAVPGMIPISSGSGPSAHYESQMESSFAAMVKEEPLTVSTTPPMSPIDMESQERIKLERKRQRNRVAASKCRRRKLERIAKLEDKVRQLKNENSDLAIVMHKLRDQVCSLKQQVMEHYNSGCQIVLNSQF